MAAKQFGLLMTESYELDISVKRDAQGMITVGMQVGDVTYQNAGNIIVASQGEFKEAPLVGVGIESMLLSHEALLYKHRINEQLSADGMTINKLEITNNGINIDVNYK